jgi:glycosyltransferase involved in cell wall biosynthesis
MRIAVNVQKLVKDKLEGLGWFTYESLKRIVLNHPEHEFLFIFGKGIDKDFIFADNVKAINIGPPFFRPIVWVFKFEFLLPLLLRKEKFDLFLSTDGWSSTRIKGKKVLVIHDLNFEHNPEMLPKSWAVFYKTFFPKWASKATRIATVSEYSKNDISTLYNIPSEQIDVVYNGINELYAPISEEEKIKVRTDKTQGNPYFVFVGALHPRKNIHGLFKAFDEFKKTDKTNHKLVIVGNKFYWNKDINAVFESMQYKDDVIFTGRLSPEDLKGILCASTALTYISLFEGFGIPLVEAMQCETAIITSNVTSLPEIAKDAALIVNPNAQEEIVLAMVKLSTDNALREALIEKGRIRRNDFSWQQTADKLWACIEKSMK